MADKRNQHRLSTAPAAAPQQRLTILPARLPSLPVDDDAAARRNERTKRERLCGSNGQESEWANGKSCAQPAALDARHGIEGVARASLLLPVPVWRGWRNTGVSSGLDLLAWLPAGGLSGCLAASKHARAIYWSRRNSKPSYADAWFLGGQLVWRHADYCGTTVQHARVAPPFISRCGVVVW